MSTLTTEQEARASSEAEQRLLRSLRSTLASAHVPPDIGVLYRTDRDLISLGGSIDGTGFLPQEYQISTEPLTRGTVCIYDKKLSGSFSYLLAELIRCSIDKEAASLREIALL